MLVISLCFSYAKLIMLGGLSWSNLPAKYNADIHYPVSILTLKKGNNWCLSIARTVQLVHLE